MSSESPEETAADAVPAQPNGVIKRFAASFREQGGLGKIAVGSLTAIVTAGVLAAAGYVGGWAVDRVSSDVAATTTVAPADSAAATVPDSGGAPFSAVAKETYGDSWTVLTDEVLPPPEKWPAGDEFRTFFESYGAVDSYSWVRFTLEGMADRTVTITEAHAAIVECTVPSPTARFTSPAEGELETIGWYFDLDERDPVAYELSSSDSKGRRYFRNRTVTLAPGEVLSIDAKAFTDASDCTWVLQLDLVVAGEEQQATVDHDGRPFRASAGRADTPYYLWAYWDNQIEFWSRSDIESGDPPDRVYKWRNNAWVEVD